MVAIANQLLQVAGDEGLRVGVSKLRMYMFLGGSDARLWGVERLMRTMQAYGCLGMVQLDASGETPLGEKA